MKKTNEILKGKKKAQHVVEFALIFPFLIAFMAFIIQEGWVINLGFKFQNTLNQAVLTSLLDENAAEYIQNKTRNIMRNYHSPETDNIEIEIIDIENTNLAAIIGTYHFKNFFTLADFLFPQNGDGYKFKAFSFINSAFLNNEGYTLDDSDVSDLILTLQSAGASSEVPSEEEDVAESVTSEMSAEEAP